LPNNPRSRHTSSNPKTKHKPLSKERPIKQAAGKGKEKKKKEKIMRERFTEKEIN
jgi:hypothetical protein